MNRRDFIKAVPVIAGSTTLLEASLKEKPSPHTLYAGELKDSDYKYFVNCYIQNQKYWPLEEYKKGIFGGDHVGIIANKDEGYMGERWINGQLRFYGFGRAVEFIDIHSRVVPFETEIAYEVFHERSQDPLVAPKHIYNYWAKLSPLSPFKETKWIHPDYIDYTADGALVEYV